MPVYERGPATDLVVVDRWAAGFGWLAHPDEAGGRVSHAIRGPDGIWLFDPLDAPGLDDRLATLGEVTGVAVLSDYHARDAGTLASRHDVPVTVPTWLSRVSDRVDAPVERTTGPVAGFSLRRLRPLLAWNEALAYRPGDRTLYAPDYLSSHPKFCVGAERVGLPTPARLSPPTFTDYEPERILFGHGSGIHAEATTALRALSAGARRRLPRALVGNLPGEIRAMFDAVRP